MLTGRTRNLGVMGWPISHSLSPVLQNAAIEKAGCDYVYTALPVKPEDLPQAVAGLKALNFRGWNVTIPHKAAIMPLLDEIDEDARIIGAVNTVVNEDGQLIGYNTDAAGFIQALLDEHFDLQGKAAALLGAGGAARAVIWGLLKAGVRAVYIGVRNPEKAQLLAADFCKHGTVEVSHWESETFAGQLGKADLLINATPLGMTPHIDAMPPVDWKNVKKEALVYDLIYTPAETRLLREARENGHPILNGEGMLAGQGAAALAKWIGKKPDALLMKTELREALTRGKK